MHENPLLPNARLKAMYALMQRGRALAQLKRPTEPRYEAIFAATMLHLEPGDFCAPLAGSAVAATLASERLAENPSALKTPQPTQQGLTYATGAALALKLGGNHRLALAFTHTGASTARTDDGWADAITYATRAELPLILLCAAVETTSRAANPKALTWPSMSRLAKSLRLPVLTVDGTDAVAVYRVMQESTHRARMGDGAAVIWCALPPASEKSAATDPIRNMQRYLSVRGLLPASSPKKRLT